MEGLLLVPPDRTALIGRPVWKPRYMVFGLAGNAQVQIDAATSSQRQSTAATRKGSLLKKTSSIITHAAAADKDNLVLSIYKLKGDQEPIQQYPLSRLKSIDIQTIQHPKKAGPPTPTLIINLEPDAAAEKLRKRRSSRTAGLSSSSSSAVLHFRSLESERYNIYDWHKTIQPMLQLSLDVEGLDEEDEGEDGERLRKRKTNSSIPMSPLSPVFSQFANPFSHHRPTTSNANRPTLPQPKGSDHTYNSMQSSRDKQTQMISPAHSLRSRRSDLSSQASSQLKQFGAAYYSSTLPSTSSDLPSPNSAYDTADQDGQTAEGWTLACRSGSAMSSHTRNSNSINTPAINHSMYSASSPPIPRESILDRAFQMRCIPGSENIPTSSTSDEKELSSIARFEAIMRKADEEKAREEELYRAQNQKSGWELEEESEEDSDDEGPLGKPARNTDDSSTQAEIPQPAQRAIDYISGRIQKTSISHSPQVSISPLSPPPPSQHRPYSSSTRGRTQTISSLNNELEGVRFQDSFDTSNGRPSISRQNSNQTTGHRRTKSNRPTSLALPPRTMNIGSTDLEYSGPLTASIVERDQRIPLDRSHTTGNVNRISTSSNLDKQQTGQEKKRLSFTEFTRRLSSTSSLLLVQTNTNISSSSGRVSSDSSGWIDTSVGNEDMRGGLRHSAIGLPRDYPREGLTSRDGGSGGLSRDEKRCGWRGSVGVFGGEGGFL